MKKRLAVSNFLIIPILILLFVLLFAIGSFVYLEIKHPDYGIRKRIAISWQALTEREWIEQFKEFEKFSKQNKETKRE